MIRLTASLDEKDHSPFCLQDTKQYDEENSIDFAKTSSDLSLNDTQTVEPFKTIFDFDNTNMLLMVAPMFSKSMRLFMFQQKQA